MFRSIMSSRPEQITQNVNLWSGWTCCCVVTRLSGALAGLGAFMDSFRLADHSGVIASYLEPDVGGLPQWVMQMWAG